MNCTKDFWHGRSANSQHKKLSSTGPVARYIQDLKILFIRWTTDIWRGQLPWTVAVQMYG